MMQQIPSSNLPSGYTKLEFIESRKTDFNDYMLINVDVFGITKAEIEYMHLDSQFTRQFAFGWYDQNWRFQAGSYDGDEIISFSEISYRKRLDKPIENKKRKVVLSTNGIYINNMLVDSRTTSPLNIHVSLVPLFARRTNYATGGEISQALHGRLYSFKLYKEEQVICNLVPCRNTKNVEGVYDTINERFYTWEVK